MPKELKKELICPVCGNVATLELYDEPYYKCKSCKWTSTDSKTVDISYRSNLNGVLSNLFPHKFVIDNVECASMESFIQSLREEDPDIQAKICSDYAGMHAYKMRTALRDWRKDGTIYWQGVKYIRNSVAYKELITRAYDALFQNIVFKRALHSFKDCHLIHSIGNDDVNETLLTEEEYRFQLKRLQSKL